MLDDLVSVIETLKQRIRTHGATLRANEIRTRVALIDPLLVALEWDVSDPALVTPEYAVGEGRADYALHGSESIPAAMVEAKRLGHALSDDERMQMLNYANARGVRYAAVTDGDVWEFYEVFKQAPLEDRRLLNLRIANTPAHELALRLLLLWRPNVASGQPVKANESVVSLVPPTLPTTLDAPRKPSVVDVPSSTELLDRDRQVLAYIQAASDALGGLPPVLRQAEMCDRIPMSLTTLQRGLSNLQRLHLLIIRETDRGRRGPRAYYLVDQHSTDSL